MRTTSNFLLACAAIALGGSVAAAASLPTIHHLTVKLPGGGIEKIAYSGDITPKVVFIPVARPIHALLPAVPFSSPFAAFDQISAETDQMMATADQQMAAAMHEADTMAAMPLMNPHALQKATLRAMPPGSQSYFVSTMSGNRVCTRQVQITSRGNGEKPQIVSHVSGNCAGANAPDGSAIFQDTPGADTQVLKVKAELAPDSGARPHI